MIEIYSKTGCGYCNKAKNLLNSLNINYKVYNMDVDFTRDFILESFPEARKFPVVLINSKFIGGYEELEQMVYEKREDIDKNLLLG